MHPLRFTVPAAAFLVSLACSNHSGAGTRPTTGGQADAPPSAGTTSAVVVPASAAAPSAGALAAPIAADAVDAGAPAPAGPPAPKVVVHMGDSMVGGFGGLTKALEGKYKALGAQFHSDTQVSLSIQTFDHEHKLQDMIARWHPDLLILTLGANDVLVPFPASLASSVQSIAKKASAGRDCYWITPAPWRKDTGIIDVVKKNAAPCKVYDSGPLRISRGGDGIHPTDGGGLVWADGFWAFYQSGGTAAAPSLLDAGTP